MLDLLIKNGLIIATFSIAPELTQRGAVPTLPSV